MELNIPECRLLEYTFQREINVRIRSLSFARHDVECDLMRPEQDRLGVTVEFVSAKLLQIMRCNSS
jgi:hypothetical protein